MNKRKKYPKITTSIEMLTVELATSLTKNHSDYPRRNVSQLYVQRYADAQRRGKWSFTGQPIIIDWHGNLLDGNHRCQTILITKIPMQVNIIRGVNPKSFKDIDGGKRRSLADCLRVAKEQYWVNLATALIMLDAYRHDQIMDGKRNKFLNDDALILLKANPYIRESLRVGAHLNTKHLISTGIGTFLHFIFSEKNKKQANTFFNKLWSGINLSKNDPVLRLREALLDNKCRQIKFRRTHKVVLVIKAWNAFRKNLPITALTWRDSKHPHESIPDII